MSPGTPEPMEGGVLPIFERPVCNVCGTTTCADDESGDDEAATSCAEDFQDEMRAVGMTDEQRAKYVEAQKKLKRFLSKEVKMEKRIDVDALVKADTAEGPFDDKPSHTVTDSRFTSAVVKPLDPTKPMTVTNADVIPAGRFPIPSALAPEQWLAFVKAARSLKQAEAAYLAAQQTYAEAVKRLSEEAVK